MDYDQYLERLRALNPTDTRALPAEREGAERNVVLPDLEDRFVPLETARRELNTVGQLLRKVEEEERSLRRLDIGAALIPQGAFAPPPKHHGPETLKMLHELRTRAYGKVVLLRSVDDGEMRCYRITQANHGYADIGVLNRLAKVAQLLVSVERGEEVNLPSGTFEVVGIAYMERYAEQELTGHAENFRRMQLHHEKACLSRCDARFGALVPTGNGGVARVSRWRRCRGSASASGGVAARYPAHGGRAPRRALLHQNHQDPRGVDAAL